MHLTHELTPMPAELRPLPLVLQLSDNILHLMIQLGHCEGAYSDFVRSWND
jgi:hypothetical protein